MEDIVKQSIETRQNAFLNSYEITDESLKKEVNDLFLEMNKVGEECKDDMDFESRFASSS